MGDTTIIRPDDFIGHAQRITALVASISEHSSLHKAPAEAASALEALTTASERLEALSDLLAHE